MATKLACDVFDTVKDIHSYLVVVKRTDLRGGAQTLHEVAADLSPRGYNRLLKMLRRGMSPAKRQPKVEQEQTE